MFFWGIFKLKFLNKQFRKDFRRANDNVLSSGVIPSINQVKSMIGFYKIARGEGIDLESASTLDIECNSF